jgi:hypothetical protein
MYFEVYDCVVDGLGAAKVAVVLNNHTTLGKAHTTSLAASHFFPR